MVQEATRSSWLCAGLCAGLMVLGHGHAQTWAVPVLCLGLPGRANSMACAEHSVPSFFAFCPCETLAVLTLGRRSFPSPQQMSAESSLGQLRGARGPWTGAPSLACPGSRFLPSQPASCGFVLESPRELSGNSDVRSPVQKA